MSMLDDLLDDYEDVAAAARRLELSWANHEGEHEMCCEKGRCLKCEQAFLRAETDLHRALLKVTPRPSGMTGDKAPRPHLGSEAGRVPTLKSELDKRSGITEYLRKLFREIEELKPLDVWGVSHAIGFRDDRVYVLVSVGDFREKVLIDALDDDPSEAAKRAFQMWQAKPHIDEDIE